MLGLVLISYLANVLTNLLHIDFPGSILGMLFVFFLLHSRLLPLKWIEEGANWLLVNLLLFFISPAVGIIQYKDLLRTQGPLLLLIILSSTVIVMAGTGLLTTYVSRLKRKDKPT